jgi:RimJ/RimL family protein N-acetyltransferase
MGIGTRALQMFLDLEATRPLYGRVAYDNYGSQRLLEKCGFNKIKVEKGFANARQAEIEEYVYKLESCEDQEGK